MRDGRWRWLCMGERGNVVHVCTDRFTSRAAAEESARKKYGSQYSISSYAHILNMEPKSDAPAE